MAYTSVKKAVITLADGKVIEVDASEDGVEMIYQGSMKQDSLRHKPRKEDEFEGLLRIKAPAGKWDEWRT